MIYQERITRQSEIEHQQEHWNEVHENLLAVQRKALEISDPKDADEQEADAVARKVVNGESAEIHGTGGTIHRKGEGAFETTSEFQSKLESKKGGGQSLDESTRSEMESKMSADFSGVKIHTGSEANSMSESINAKAFTHGQDVFFKQGAFNTSSNEGKELLAHELTHTVQQSGKIQPKIQRKHGDNKLTVDVTGPIPHADGIYNATTGTLRTPKDDSGYTETLKVYPDDLFDTYYSIANRFGISVEDLMAENPTRTEDKIFHNIDIYIPDIPPKQHQLPNQIPEDTFPGRPRIPSVEYEEYGKEPEDEHVIVYKTADEEWQEIKRGAYNGSAQAQYNAALKVKSTYTYLNLIPADKALVDDIITKQGNVYVRTFEKDYVKYDMTGKKKENIITDVQKAAWAIVQSDEKVRHTYQFLHKIKVGKKQAERDKELFKFFNGGPYEPKLEIPLTYATTGGTPAAQHGVKKHKVIQLNPNNSFAVDVATYMHELNHYMDIWYSSGAALMRGKFKASREQKGGVAPESASDLSTTEQTNALQEYLNVIIEEILQDMQYDLPQDNENPHTIAERKLYKAWDADTNPKKDSKDKFINDRREALRKAALDPDNGYANWGGTQGGPGGAITATGLEIGYAFEKQAYGFYDPGKAPGEWAENFVDKFEKKYWTYLENR